jgi:hypothetical protein
MADFNFYENQIFLNIIKEIYKIEEVKVMDNNDLNKRALFYKSKIKIGNIFNMPFNFYNFVNLNKIDFDYLKEYSIKNNINIVIKTLELCNLKNRIPYANNPIISLSDVQYSKNLYQNIRRNINKCNRFGISIEMLNNIADLRYFYKNVFSTMYIDKHKMVFQPLELFEQLYIKNIVDIFIAKKNNKILGGLICIKDGDTLHYNWGATLNFENIALGTVLINFAILYAKENEYNFFDLGSTPISDHALFDYKMRWGAINYPVYEYYTLFKPNQIDLNSSYKVSRQIYSKFPKSFLRWLMPKIIPYLVQ